MDAIAGLRQQLAELYHRSGPFVTVYLDATRSTEAGAHEVALRWADLRRDLEASGADGDDLAALDTAVEQDTGTPGRHGLVAVAAGGTLLLDDVLTDPPSSGSAGVSGLPHLMPYLAQRSEAVPHVVVVTDHAGADILAVSGDTGRVDGSSTDPLHRTGRNDWSERHFQQRVENAWEANARDVAGAVRRQVDAGHAALVVIAGDVRARTMVADDVRRIVPSRVQVRAVEAGGRGAGSSGSALESAVHREVLHLVWAQRREVLAHAQQNLGRGQFAVAGIGPVLDAVRMGQADTVIVSDDPSSTLRAWVGPAPNDFGLDPAEADTLGVEVVSQDRFDAALVRGVVGTGAQLLITPGAHSYVADGIAALLRYDM